MANLDDLLDELSGPMGENMFNSTTFGASTFGQDTFSSDPRIDELAGLMDELAVGGKPSSGGSNNFGVTTTDFNSLLSELGEDTTDVPAQHIETEELDQLVNNLDVGDQYSVEEGYVEEQPQQQFQDPDDELDNIMNELGGSNKQSRASAMPSESELDQLMGDLSGGFAKPNPVTAKQPQRQQAQSVTQAQRPQQQQYQQPQQSRAQPKGAANRQPQRQSQAPVYGDPLNELDSLMNDLGGPTTSTYDQTQELDSLMDQLAPRASSVPDNNANRGRQQSRAVGGPPTEDLSDLNSLIDGIESDSGAPAARSGAAAGRGAAARSGTPAGMGNGRGNTPGNRASAMPPTGRAAQRNSVAPGARDEDLDEIMRNLDAPIRSSNVNNNSNVNINVNSGVNTKNNNNNGRPSLSGNNNNNVNNNAGAGRGKPSDLDRIMAGLNDEMDNLGDFVPATSGRGRGAPAAGAQGAAGRGAQQAAPKGGPGRGAGRGAQQPLPPGVCSACRKYINGEMVQAMGRSYHAAHFNCSTCSKNIGTRNFYEREGQPQCETCFQSHFCRKCGHCGQPITNQITTALNQSWHPNCFVCTSCLTPFNGGNFFERESRPYCGKCFNSIFSQKCRGCGEAIAGGSVTALGGYWHPEHFACTTCAVPFDSGIGFFERDGLPYCQTHYYS